MVRVEYRVDGELIAVATRDADGHLPGFALGADEGTLEVLGYDAAGALVGSGAPIVDPVLPAIMEE